MIFKPVDPFILTSKISVFINVHLKQYEAQREAEIRHKLQENLGPRREDRHQTGPAALAGASGSDVITEAQQRILIEELSAA